MAYKDKEKEKEYKKAYYQAHKKELNAYQKAYYQYNREDIKAYHQAHRDEYKDYNKSWYQEHREERNAYQKAYNQSHREERNAYMKSDTNSQGNTKNSIRKKSSSYLFNVLKHTKLEGYEIHHCFGYDDYKKFIYIPKELHLQIHQFLRDNGISADTDHYNQISQLIINYIKCNEKHILILKQSQ